LARCNDNTKDYWAVPSEDSILDNLNSAWENGCCTTVVFTIILALFNVGCKLIEQMINNLSGKDLDTFLFCELKSIFSDRYVECEDTSVLLHYLLFVFTAKNFGSFCDILLVNWSNSDIADWNL
jgi:hypothetical protein